VQQPLRPEHNGCFAFQLTPAQLAGKTLVIALEVDGRFPEAGRDKPRPSGVTGTLLLQAWPQPLSVTPLSDWSIASDLGQLTPAAVGTTVTCSYLETRFTLPKAWPSKRLVLRAPVAMGILFINNQFIAAPPAMTELDISGLVVATGENLLRWVPIKNYHHQHQPYQGPVHGLELLWMP
ncbi:MAG: hypothetical protein H0W72_17440, partial [Planctomycetes bacterium]|nr:hypothetical protein [Planctomycetota bacterium]